MQFRFGQFVLDRSTGSLIGPDGPVSLRRQTYRLLEVLLEHAPGLVDHDTLLDEAWGRTALSPNVLPQAVSELRQALGDSAADPTLIETLHRRGYRIIPEVERFEGTASPETDRSTYAQPLKKQSISRWAWLVALAIPATLIAVWWQLSADQRWLEKEALPTIHALKETDVAAAWRLAYKARQRVEDDPRLEQLWLDLALPVNLDSTPSGAVIEVAGYYGPSPAEWVKLGHTPLEDQRLPVAPMRFRVSEPGFETIEVAPSVLPKPEVFQLHPEGKRPDGMVFVPAGPVRYQQLNHELPEFWIDRYEVTNIQYKQFIDAGGYNEPELWPEKLELDALILDRKALLAQLVDGTGMPGPSSWALGTFAEGQDQHPVEGISWYEASAYAQWVGKQLPTVLHWYRAAGLGTSQAALFAAILTSSNFDQNGTVPVGESGGLGPYGTYDMAGNVREWCANSAGTLRYAMGAMWEENSYQFSDWTAFDPLRRDTGFGLRLIRLDHSPEPSLLSDMQFPVNTRTDPVDDETFAIYASHYDYDQVPLNAEVVEVDDSHADWRRERVEFDAVYADERVTVQLLIPRNAVPPYQSVVHFPGGDARMLGDSRNASLIHVEPFLRTGRVIVYPVIQGTFERSAGGVSGPIGVRDQIFQQVKDFRRTLDYLDTRQEFDKKAVVFHAVSYGASRSMFVLGVEDRFQMAMLVSTGLSPTAHLPPEIQQIDYLHRIRIPVLLITGRNDVTFPYETSQRLLFASMGTPPEAKLHVAPDWGHLPPGYHELSRQLINWTDRWLGPADIR